MMWIILNYPLINVRCTPGPNLQLLVFLPQQPVNPPHRIEEGGGGCEHEYYDEEEGVGEDAESEQVTVQYDESAVGDRDQAHTQD